MGGILPSAYRSRAEFRRSPEASIYLEPACRSQRSLFENSKVLDIGCGPGNYGPFYLSLGASSVEGIDQSAANIEEAKSCSGDTRLRYYNLNFYKDDLSQLGTYDLIVGFWTLHFSPLGVEWEEIAKRMLSLLTPRGRLLTIAQFPTHVGRYQPFARLKYPGLADGDPLPDKRCLAPFELLDGGLDPILSITCAWPKQDELFPPFKAAGLPLEQNIALDPVIEPSIPEVYRRLIFTFRAMKGADPHPTRLLIFKRS